MSVTLDFTQSGGGSTKISAANGDTITLKLASTEFNNTLANAVAGLGALTQVTGVAVSANYTAATCAVEARQSGSAATVIFAASGDTITLELAETVQSDTLAAANVYLQQLKNQSGVSFAVNTSGGAT